MANSIPLTASTRRKNPTQRQKRNGWAAKWSDELKLKEGESAWVMLTPGKYPTHEGDVAPYLEVPMFKVQYENRWGNTSWGYYRGNKGRCTLQERADCGDNRVSEPKYGKPNRFFMNVIHFDLFKRVEVIDKKTGTPMRYKGGKLKGEIVYRWEAVTSIKERKDLLRSGNLDDVCFFRKKFIELPASHFEKLQSIGHQAASMCRCGGSLFPAVYLCSECEEILLDVDSTDLSEGDVRRFGDNMSRCNSCGHVGYPEAHSLCDTCDDPAKLAYWEVAAQISKVREGQWPTYRVDRVVPIGEFTLADGSPVIALDRDGNPEISEEGKYMFPDDLQKLVSSQFDLEEYTAAKENSEYSDMLGLREGDIGYAADSTEYSRWR